MCIAGRDGMLGRMGGWMIVRGGTVVGVKGSGEPSTGRQIEAGVALFLVDLVVIAWLLYSYGMTGWADGYDPVNVPEAPQVARRAMWLLAVGAAVTGGGLLALRRRLPGVVQLLVLGGGAVFFACLAARP